MYDLLTEHALHSDMSIMTHFQDDVSIIYGNGCVYDAMARVEEQWHVQAKALGVNSMVAPNGIPVSIHTPPSLLLSTCVEQASSLSDAQAFVTAAMRYQVAHGLLADASWSDAIDTFSNLSETDIYALTVRCRYDMYGAGVVPNDGGYVPVAQHARDMNTLPNVLRTMDEHTTAMDTMLHAHTFSDVCAYMRGDEVTQQAFLAGEAIPLYLRARTSAERGVRSMASRDDTLEGAPVWCTHERYTASTIAQWSQQRMMATYDQLRQVSVDAFSHAQLPSYEDAGIRVVDDTSRVVMHARQTTSSYGRLSELSDTVIAQRHGQDVSACMRNVFVDTALPVRKPDGSMHVNVQLFDRDSFTPVGVRNVGDKAMHFTTMPLATFNDILMMNAVEPYTEADAARQLPQYDDEGRLVLRGSPLEQSAHRALVYRVPVVDNEKGSHVMHSVKGFARSRPTSIQSEYQACLARQADVPLPPRVSLPSLERG